MTPLESYAGIGVAAELPRPHPRHGRRLPRRRNHGAELAIAGKPAILIPYPFAADNCQELNAREMAEAGAALMFRQSELTAAGLADALRPLLDDPARRHAMGAAMKAIARSGAAAAVIDWCEAQAHP